MDDAFWDGLGRAGTGWDGLGRAGTGWDELHALFGEDELANLTICCGAWLGMGRVPAVLGVPAPRSASSSGIGERVRR
jgi:hypothetical protein